MVWVPKSNVIVWSGSKFLSFEFKGFSYGKNSLVINWRIKDDFQLNIVVRKLIETPQLTSFWCFHYWFVKFGDVWWHESKWIWVEFQLIIDGNWWLQKKLKLVLTNWMEEKFWFLIWFLLTWFNSLLTSCGICLPNERMICSVTYINKASKESFYIFFYGNLLKQNLNWLIRFAQIINYKYKLKMNSCNGRPHRLRKIS